MAQTIGMGRGWGQDAWEKFQSKVDALCERLIAGYDDSYVMVETLQACKWQPVDAMFCLVNLIVQTEELTWVTEDEALRLRGLRPFLRDALVRAVVLAGGRPLTRDQWQNTFDYAFSYPMKRTRMNGELFMAVRKMDDEDTGRKRGGSPTPSKTSSTTAPGTGDDVETEDTNSSSESEEEVVEKMEVPPFGDGFTVQVKNTFISIDQVKTKPRRARSAPP